MCAPDGTECETARKQVLSRRINLKMSHMRLYANVRPIRKVFVAFGSIVTVMPTLHERLVFIIPSNRAS